MFIPLYDIDNKFHRVGWPFVTHTFIAINVAVFAYLNLLPFEEGYGTLVSLSFKPEGVPAAAAEFPMFHLPEAVGAFTSMFTQYEFWHLAGNMLALWVFGDNVEDAMGHVRFAAFYVACGMAAAYAQALLALEPQTVMFGASGAVSGVIVSFVLLHPRVRVWVLVLMRYPMRLTAFWIIGAWVAYQIVNLFIADSGSQIGWAAHVAGILVGAALTPILKRPGVPLLDGVLSRPDHPSEPR